MFETRLNQNHESSLQAAPRQKLNKYELLKIRSLNKRGVTMEYWAIEAHPFKVAIFDEREITYSEQLDASKGMKVAL